MAPTPTAVDARADRPPSRLAARLCHVARLACICRAGLLADRRRRVWQVFGRYVLNNSPTWAESLALVLILYVTLLGAAVGVRDAGHIGMESLLVLVPERLREKMRARDPRAGRAVRRR